MEKEKVTLAFDPYSILWEAAINQVQAAIGRPLLDEELSSVKQSVEKILTQTKEKYNPDPIIPVDVHFNNEEDEWDLYRKEEKIRQTIRLAMYSCLDLRPKSRDYLSQETGLPPEKTAGILMELEIMDLVREIGRHYYIRSRTWER